MSLFRRVSITRKFITLALLVSATAWGLLDCIQSRMIEAIFQRHVDIDLETTAREDRELFDAYLASFRQSVRVLITNRKLTDHLLSPEWSAGDHADDPSVLHRRIPKWLPGRSVLRAMPLVHYFLLLDRDAHIREIFSGDPGTVPAELRNPRPLFHELTHKQSLLTRLGEEPFVVTSEIILSENETVLGYLMLASRINNDFLYASVQGMNRDNLIALIDNHADTLIAVNRSDASLSGVSKRTLAERYHLVGKSFFDYGASDLDAHFISMIPKEHYRTMGRDILVADRLNRALTGLSILACLCVILFIITRRIARVTSGIDTFAEQELQTAMLSSRSGDQLLVLEERFQVLGQQVIETRNNLQEQVAERTKEYQTANCLLEAEIKERIAAERQLKSTLAEKEALLKEIHHRVKNNMQIVASLMFLQARNIENPEALGILQESQERVKSMALVHELLYRSDNLSKVPFSSYIETLVRSLRESYSGVDSGITVGIEAEGIDLPVDTAVPCGLIANELITNSFKYAFPDNRPGMLRVCFSREHDQHILSVRDNGVGLPDGYDWKTGTTLGLNLVRTLSAQLDGRLDFENDNGLTCRLSFKLPERGRSVYGDM